jgi:nicotinamidase-related amidase
MNKKPRNILFIIDPQVDFHPGGSLGVPGAHEDSTRIADFIRKNSEVIDEIIVSLDSHHRIHIAHGVFWKNEQGEHPPPFTLIRSTDIEQGTWVPVDNNLLEHAKNYTRALEEKGRFVVCIWPEHCLIGTPGHAVTPVVNKALQEWVQRRMTAIQYIHKGTNCLTEMYSAIAAEVPMSDDPSTGINQELIEHLHTADRVLICGEAKSHCVNYTMRDIAAHWRKEQSALVLLSDCTSAVPGFEAAAETFEADMKARGCSIRTSTNADL